MCGAPIISVIMAVHNNLRYLPEAVDSILNQSFRNFEFIIIDDGSSDGSGEWLENKAGSDPRIRLLRQENAGLTISLNTAAAMAGGKYLARMDGDDISLPDRFEKQLAFLEANPDHVIAGTGLLKIDEEGDPLFIQMQRSAHEWIDRACLMGNGAALSHPTVMMRADAFRKAGGYNPKFPTAQDLDLYLRLCEIGKASNLREPLLKWRQHPQSINRTRFDTWKAVKTMAVSDAIRRRGVNAFVQNLFGEEGRGMDDSFDEQCLRMAKAGNFPRTALKHLRRIVERKGFSLWAVRQVFGIVERAVKKRTPGISSQPGVPR